MASQRQLGGLFLGLFICLGPVCGRVSWATDERAERVAKVLEEWSKPDAPGAAWIVVSDRQVIAQGAFGIANLEQRTPITAATRFNLGSMSKQFTALAVLRLEKEGKLSLDDSVHRWLPELPDYGKTITLRHLIHHTSGLQDWDQLLHLAGWRLEDVITNEQVLRIIRVSKELNFEPGERFAYSNSGYSLLAAVIERCAREPFSVWMTANVFQPLGLDGACVQDDVGMVLPQRAESYLAAGGGHFRHIPDNAAILGASSIYCSIEVFTKYLEAFDDPRRSELLARQTELAALNSGGANSYACGVELGHYKGFATVSHGGGWAGFRTLMLRFPERKLSIALFSNHGSIDPAPLVSQIADIYLGIESAISAKTARHEIELESSVLNRYVGQYELAPGLIISITKEGNQLMSQATGFPKEPLFAESKDAFFFKVEKSTMKFVEENAGVSRLVLNRQGQEMQARRMKLAPPSMEALAEYLGDYVNPDLETKITVRVQNGHLVASHIRHRDIELISTGVDTFAGDQWWLGQLIFKRDHEKRVIAFQVPGSRIRSVLFTRRER
jgi:CubicO group peptidase (beta-lactamase class C family)